MNKIEYIKLPGGFYLFIYYKEDFYAPAGFVWGVFPVSDNGKKIFNTYGSFVLPYCRREGIRTKINNYIFNECESDVIISVNSSTEEGKSFLESSGYIIDQKTSIWVLTKNKHIKTQKSKQKKIEIEI